MKIRFKEAISKSFVRRFAAFVPAGRDDAAQSARRFLQKAAKFCP
jgi:hypothetical protein